MDQVSEIASQILRYLDEHPEAADSVGAIARWWLHESDEAEVGLAVEQLVARGQLVASTRSGERSYSRVRRR